MTDLPFADLPRRLYSCTPTRLTTWLDCPRRYRFTYVDRPPPTKGPPWAHLSLGTSLHNALRLWWALPPAARTPAAAVRVLREQWQSDGYRDAAHSVEYRERAAEWVSDYVEQLDPADEPLGVERTVALRTDRLAFSGRVDRVDDRMVDGAREAVVVDYKTGRSVSSVDEARSSLALALYALAVGRTLRRPCVQVELHHLPTGTTAAWRHDEESLTRHLRRATELADDAQLADSQRADSQLNGEVTSDESVDRVYPPRPGAQCTWCDYRAHCPEGSAVSTPVKPWAALDNLRSAE
jgi:RecB family exonuclease